MSSQPKTGTGKTSKTRPRGIYIDLKRCIGCNACSLACKQENNVRIGERWNEVYGVESLGSSALSVRVLPMLCQQCGSAPCKKVCDGLGFKAIVQRPDGILYVDTARCVGCGKCVPACPYRAIFLNPETRKAEKCHFCMHRIDRGLAPACVITCLAITREWDYLDALKSRHPGAKQMGDNVKVLYDNLGDEPEAGKASPTAGYPDPVPCHD